MEPKDPKLPTEAIELYNLFIHGEISSPRVYGRRAETGDGGLAAATVIEALMPNYAQGQQVSKTDDRIKATYETVPSPQGQRKHQGISRPARQRRHAIRDGRRNCRALSWSTKIAG